MRNRITPNTDTFYTVQFSLENHSFDWNYKNFFITLDNGKSNRSNFFNQLPLHIMQEHIETHLFIYLSSCNHIFVSMHEPRNATATNGVSSQHNNFS